MTDAGTIFCTKCGRSRTPDDSRCQNCGALRYQSPALFRYQPPALLRVEGRHEDGGYEPNEVRRIASELRSLAKGEQILVFDAMIYAARAKGSVRVPDVSTVYEAFTLTGTAQADRISILKRLLSDAKTRALSGFPSLRPPASLWLMSALLKLTDAMQGNLTVSEFLNDFADHLGIKPTARESFFAKANQLWSLRTASNLFQIINSGLSIANAYEKKGLMAAGREAGDHVDAISELSEVVEQVRLPVHIVRQPSQIARQLLNMKSEARKMSPQAQVEDLPPSHLPETNEHALLHYFMHSLAADITWLRDARCFEWPSTKRFRKTALPFLSAMRSEVPGVLESQ